MKKWIGGIAVVWVFLFLSLGGFADTPPPKVTIGTPANGLSITGQRINLGLSSGSSIGALSASDWTTFNSKQASGSYITALSSDVVATGPGSATATIQSGVVSNSKLANMATQTFKGRTTSGTGSPEDLTATQATAMLNPFSSSLQGLAPASGGGTTNFLRADGTWNPAGTGSVSSVALSLPSIFTVSGSPVTTAGTLTGSFNTQTANTVFSGPSSGGAATPTFRSLVAADIPTISGSQVSGGTFGAVDGSALTSLNASNISSGTLSGARLPSFTGDVTNSSAAMTVAAIQGKTVSGTTGTGNVVFSNAPAFTGNMTGVQLGLVGSIGAANLSGTNTGDQTITLTGDVTGSGTGSFAATVAKIQTTVVSGTTGSGNVVFSTSPTLVTPALGTPSALVGTNITGTAAGLTAGNVTTNANLTGDVTSVGNATTVAKIQTTTVSGTTGSGNVVFSTSPTLVTPALGTPSALVGTNITGTASGLTAGNVTTNANLTGPITSVGNATSIASKTGTGNTFAMSASPAFTGNITGVQLGLVGSIGAANLSGTNTGDVTLTAVGASPNANAASLSGQALTLQPASSTQPGVVTAGTQTLGGVKTFANQVVTAASTTSASSLNIPSGVAPTSPSFGDLWSTSSTGLLSFAGGSVATVARNVAMTDMPFMGMPLTGAKVIHIFGSNLPIGDNDLYTVPAGKRAFYQVAQDYNPTGSNITEYMEIKVSGTYYRIQTNATLTGNTGGTLGTAAGIVLEAGETLSVNTATTAGLNIWPLVIEFDNTSNLKTSKLLGLASGANTLYTCPASHSCTLITSVPGALLGLAGNIAVVTNGSSPTLTHYLVPSGGTPGTTNQAGVLATGGATRSSMTAVPGMSAGDFISVNSTGSDATTITWVNVLEVPTQ